MKVEILSTANHRTSYIHIARGSVETHIFVFYVDSAGITPDIVPKEPAFLSALLYTGNIEDVKKLN